MSHARSCSAATLADVLILLPPSEMKAPGGDGDPLELTQLSFEQLNPTRDRIARALCTLSSSPRRAAKVLSLGPRQLDELQHNLDLRTSPTMPAIERYQGVLYDALDIDSLTRLQHERALQRLAIGSALFGLLRAADPIPAYRLSAATTLPRLGTLSSLWRPKLQPVLEQVAAAQLVIDLRSGAYQALAPLSHAVTVRVLHERADGSRGVVSHFNKATKGRLARMLATTKSSCDEIEQVERVVRRSGMQVERSGELSLDVVTRG